MKNALTEKEKKILDTLTSIIPQFTALEKERVLGYVEGMSAIKSAAGVSEPKQ